MAGTVTGKAPVVDQEYRAGYAIDEPMAQVVGIIRGLVEAASAAKAISEGDDDGRAVRLEELCPLLDMLEARAEEMRKRYSVWHHLTTCNRLGIEP